MLKQKVYEFFENVKLFNKYTHTQTHPITGTYKNLANHSTDQQKKHKLTVVVIVLPLFLFFVMLNAQIRAIVY